MINYDNIFYMITCILIWRLSTKLYLPVWALSPSPGLELEIKLVGNLCSFESEYWIWNIERMWPPASSIHNPSLHSQQTLKFAYLKKMLVEREQERTTYWYLFWNTQSESMFTIEAKLCWGLTSIIRKCCLSIELDLCHWRKIAALSPFAVSMYPIYE